LDQCLIDFLLPDLYSSGMITALLFLFLFFNSAAYAWDAIYQCPDGTFTNRADLHCARYAAPPPPPDASGPSPPVTRRLESDTLSKPASSSVQQGEDSSAPCTVYGQWLELDRQTSGGSRFATTKDQRRWTTLSRMYRYLGPPRCAMSGNAVPPHGIDTP
jgi:hypothetical protein